MMNAWLEDLKAFSDAIQSRGKTDFDEGNIVETAIGIYRNNVRGNLRGALGIAYPVIQSLVGDEFFAMLAIRYIESHPSRSGNLHDYGGHFGEFLNSVHDVRDLPYLPDVAKLEWACHLAYFAPDAGPIDIVALTRIDPEHQGSLCFRMNPACHIVFSSFPIVTIWQAHQPGMPEDFFIEARGNPHIALVSRKEDRVRVVELKESEAKWLEAIRSGIPLWDATEAALGSHPDFELRLSHWIAGEVFTGFEGKST